MTALKVLVVGGGIAGNALAFWLTRLDCNVTVVEKHPELRANGLQLDLRGHGIDVLKRMGLEAAFRSMQAPEQGFQIVDKSGRRRAYFPANKTGTGVQDFTSDWEIMRGDLCRLIHDGTARKARYIFDTTIKSLENQENHVIVQFTNGTVEQFDLVVGADGQSSCVRNMMHGDGDTVPSSLLPLGGYVGYLRIPKPIEAGEEFIATWYFTTKSRFIMTRRHSEREMQAYLMSMSNEGPIAKAWHKGAEQEREAFTDFFKDAGWKANELIEALKTSEDFHCERIAFVRKDRWSQGRITLIGDAAHCPSVMTGMGTTSAIVGAYVLAGELARHCPANKEHRKQDLLDALSSYEDVFRPFMDQVQKGLSEHGWSYWPTTEFGISVLNYLAGIVAALRLNAIGSWFLKEKIKDWELPDYAELHL